MANRNDDRHSREVDRELFEQAFRPVATRRKTQPFVFSPDTAVSADAGHSQQSLEFSAWQSTSGDDQDNGSRITCHIFPNSLDGVVDKIMAQMELHGRSNSTSTLYRRISSLGIRVLRAKNEVIKLRTTLAESRRRLSADELGFISNPSTYGFGHRYWLGHRRKNIPIYDSYQEDAERLTKDLAVSQSTFGAIMMLAAVSRSRWVALTDAQEEADLELKEFFELHVARVRRRYEESLSSRARGARTPVS